MHKQLVVSLADLRFVSIECPLCKTVVTLDMKEPHDWAQKYDTFSPKDCPGCGKSYDSAIRPHVDGFQKAYHGLIDIADRISFRGIAENTAI